jgi:hypothetical protein
MTDVGHPLAEPDEGTVVLRESCRLDELPDRDVPQARQDLGPEHVRLGHRALPRPDGTLVCGVLGTAPFGCATAVPWVTLFGA